MTVPLNSNGHRRRQLRARVLAEETHCALCDQPVDKKLKVEQGKHYKNCDNTSCQGCKPHPMRAEVDETIARKFGGSPLDRANTRLMHRQCNQAKGVKSLEQARNEHHGTRTKRPTVSASPIW